MTKFNDINIDKWKESEIWTDSLWLISERDKSGKHSNSYHGNFVPQLPHQLILRYTKTGDIVFDPFVGNGTTVFECETLNRNYIGIDIQANLIEQIRAKIDKTDSCSELIVGDSTEKKTINNVKSILEKYNKKRFSLQLYTHHIQI